MASPAPELPSSESRVRSTLRRLLPILPIALLVLAGVTLHRELHGFRWHDVWLSLEALRVPRLAVALLLVALNYLCLTLYDVLALRHLGKALPYPRVGFASFIGYALGHNIGLAFLSGGSVRLRLYGAWGLTGVDVAQVMGFNGLTFWVGVFTVGGTAAAARAGRGRLAGAAAALGRGADAARGRRLPRPLREGHAGDLGARVVVPPPLAADRARTARRLVARLGARGGDLRAAPPRGRGALVRGRDRALRARPARGPHQPGARRRRRLRDGGGDLALRPGPRARAARVAARLPQLLLPAAVRGRDALARGGRGGAKARADRRSGPQGACVVRSRRPDGGRDRRAPRRRGAALLRRDPDRARAARLAPAAAPAAVRRAQPPARERDRDGARAPRPRAAAAARRRVPARDLPARGGCALLAAQGRRLRGGDAALDARARAPALPRRSSTGGRRCSPSRSARAGRSPRWSCSPRRSGSATSRTSTSSTRRELWWQFTLRGRRAPLPARERGGDAARDRLRDRAPAPARAARAEAADRGRLRARPAADRRSPPTPPRTSRSSATRSCSSTSGARRS